MCLDCVAELMKISHPAGSPSFLQGHQEKEFYIFIQIFVSTKYDCYIKVLAKRGGCQGKPLEGAKLPQGSRGQSPLVGVRGLCL